MFDNFMNLINYIYSFPMRKEAFPSSSQSDILHVAIKNSLFFPSEKFFGGFYERLFNFGNTGYTLIHCFRKDA